MGTVAIEMWQGLLALVITGVSGWLGKSYLGKPKAPFDPDTGKPTVDPLPAPVLPGGRLPPWLLFMVKVIKRLEGGQGGSGVPALVDALKAATHEEMMERAGVPTAMFSGVFPPPQQDPAKGGKG